MITLHPISAGSGVDYLLGSVAHGDVEARGDERELSAYLSEHGDSPGQWLGRGAALLGLDGEVTDKAADAVFKHGTDPVSGQVLGRRFPQIASAQDRYRAMLAAEPQASEQRRAALWAKASKAGNASAKSGWEMVFSPVNSFSVAWGLADDPGRARLEAAEEKAFRATLARLENEVAWTRIGSGGAAQVKADGLIAAVFVHRSSRAGDPTYHRHLAISAKVPYTDTTGRRRWLALDSPPLHAMTVALSEFYTAALEREMAALGHLAAPRAEVIGKRPVREYVGVPEAALAEFSSRRRQTEKAYAALHADFLRREAREPTRAEAYRMYQAAALTDRPDKRPRGRREEREHWRARAAAKAGITDPAQLETRMLQASAQLASRSATGRTGDWRAEATARVLAELGQRRGSWRRSNVEAEATRQLVAAGAHLSPQPLATLVREVVDRVLGDGDSVRIDLPDPVPTPSAYRREDGESVFRAVNAAHYTSRTLLAAERQLIDSALTPAAVRVLAAGDVDRALAAGQAARGFAPSPAQRDVVHAVFAANARLAAVLGRAGTGKTTLMRLVREVADANAIPVLGLTAGQVQADTLAGETGIRTENIARWRVMSEQVHPGHPDWTLAPGTLLIVDEAGQAGTMDLAALRTQVDAAGGRLLLVGDPLQTGSVAAGGLLAELEYRGAAVATLDQVQRFRDHDGRLRTWETQASLALARGRAEDSFTAYDARGRIHAGSAEAMAEAALRAYLRDTAHGLASILIAPDNATAADLSARVRELRQAEGLVRTGRETTLSDENTASIGDIVATRRNDRSLTTAGGRGYVRNGDTWTVTQVRDDGVLVVRDRISGARAELPPEYVAEHVTLAYAITQHRAQGLTLDTAHALVDAQMSRNNLYPALTRGRYENHAYLLLTEAIDPETGAPGRATTPRHVWTRVVERDGTEQAATAAIRAEHRQAAALGGLYQRLRYVLDDLGTERIAQRASAALGEHAAHVTLAPAWPALAELLRILDAEGHDPAAVLAAALSARDLTGAVDPAAVLHARIAADPRHAAAAARHTLADVQVAGPGMLRLLGILPPPESVPDPRARYARALADAITARMEQVTADAANAAWTRRLYGRPPAAADHDAAEAYRARIQAAALYRDLTGRHDENGDLLGPPPAPGQYGLRVLWRRAQPPPDTEQLRARALAADAAGERWIRHLGPAPADPRLYPAWAAAAAAALEYRERWDIGAEHLLLGAPPADRVQAADHRAAQQRIAVYRAAADGAPAALIPASAPANRAQDQARAELYTARRRATALTQHLADLTNRADAVRSSTQNDPARPGLLGNLLGQISRTRAELRHAQRRVAELEELSAPGAHAWAARPYGHLSDRQLQARLRTLTGEQTTLHQHEAQLDTWRQQQREGRGPAVTEAENTRQLAATRATSILALRRAQDIHDRAKTAWDQAAAEAARLHAEARGLAVRAEHESRLTARRTRAAAEQLQPAITAADRNAAEARAAWQATLPALAEARRTEQHNAARTPGDAQMWLEVHERHQRDWPGVLAEARNTDHTRIMLGMREIDSERTSVATHADELAGLRAEAAIRAALPEADRARDDRVRAAQARAAQRVARDDRQAGRARQTRPAEREAQPYAAPQIDRDPIHHRPPTIHRPPPTHQPPGPQHGLGR